LDKNLPKIFATLDEKKEIGLSRSTNLISSVSKLIIWLTAFLLLLTLFDIEITAAVASLTVFSLVIGMALQESASNMIISGQLMLDSPYDIGDKIEINGRIGVVTDIGVLSTKVRTPGEQLMVIPNKIMATSTITNFARGGSKEYPERVNLRIDIGVGYNESPEHVKNVIREILQENDKIVDEPTPLILLTDLLDSALSFRVNTHVINYQDEMIVRDQILIEIIRRFREERIEIPFPHLQVLRETDDIDSDKKKLARVKKAEKEEAKISENLILERNAIQEKIEIARDSITDEEDPEKVTELQEEIIELESKLFIDED
jgi:small-conductance mechanosensitive channel